ncbi:MAG: hypothetical protein NVS2B1_14070 [Bradyrhizobium sp.]
MESAANVVVYAGLLIGLLYGAVGLLSGFCLMSSLRGWWAKGDSRLVRTYALALGVAIAATQLLAAGGFVDLGKTIYLQPSFSAPLMFAGGLLFGYGMVLANGCGSRALVLLGRGNLRSFVVVIVLGIAAEMTLKGLIAPARIAVLQKDPELGERLFQKALESSPDPQVQAWTLVYLGRLSGSSGDREQAVKHYQQALAVSGASPMARQAAEKGLQESKP